MKTTTNDDINMVNIVGHDMPTHTVWSTMGAGTHSWIEREWIDFFGKKRKSDFPQCLKWLKFWNILISYILIHRHIWGLTISLPDLCMWVNIRLLKCLVDSIPLPTYYLHTFPWMKSWFLSTTKDNGNNEASHRHKVDRGMHQMHSIHSFIDTLK